MKSIQDLLDGYINNNTHLSRGSIVAYERMARKYGDMDLTKAKYNDIMEVVRREKNPNSQAAVLNIAILLTQDRKELHTRLQREREPLKERIEARRKGQLERDNDDLPSYDDIVAIMNEMTGLDYIINFLLINYALRNMDFMLQNFLLKQDVPDDKGNYIHYNKKLKCVSLFISSYKTSASYGTKIINICDTKYINEFRGLVLNDGEYLISTQQRKKPSASYLSDILLNRSVSGLGEGRIMKIVTKHLLEKYDYKKLQEISASRGTSLAVILSSYNLMNNK